MDHALLRLARSDAARDPGAPSASGCGSVLSAAGRGALFGVIDAAVGIRTLDELRHWSRGALQNILPHAMFACGLGSVRGRRLMLRPVLLDGFRVALPHRDSVTANFRLISQLVLRCWRQRTPQLLQTFSDTAGAGNALGNCAAHGVFDTGGPELSFIALCRIPARPDGRHTYALRLLAPSLHVVLQRVRSAENISVREAPSAPLQLSAREGEVLRWLRQGKSAWEVAQILARSEYTVKNQMRSIYRKLGAANRAQALFRASQIAIPD